MVVSLPVRSPVQSPVRSTLGRVSATFLDEMLAYGAIDAWDFTSGAYLRSGSYTNNPGLTVTRASEGYAETSDGRLLKFGSGVLRRTDKGVLVEGARTNLLLRSQEFDDAGWTKGGTTVSVNSIAAPDGTTTADTMTEDTSTGDHRTFQNIVVSNATVYTYSVYVKPNGRSLVSLTFAGVGEAIFNVSTGAVTNTVWGTASIVAATNGWYRCIITFTTTTTSYNAQIRLVSTGTTTSYTGDGTSGIYIWGAQLEAASFPSSYIPTEASTVTRAADVVTAVPTSGTDYPLSLFAEFERVVDTGGVERILVADAGSSTAEAAAMSISNFDEAVASQFAASATVAVVTITGAIAVNALTKMGARFGLNSVQACRGGTLGNEDTSAASPTTPTTLRIGNRSAGDQPSFGYIRRCAIFNTALSDADLQEVTT